MTTASARLVAALASRLPFAQAVDPLPPSGRPTVDLAPIAYVVRPGLLRLEPLPEADGRAYIQLRQADPSGFWKRPAAMDVHCVTMTLDRLDHARSVDVEICEPVEPVYSKNRRWRSLAPSKRKRCRSWLRSPDHVKLAYAPLRGKCDTVPPWARHPDHNRIRRIGDATVRQRVFVYAQRGVHGEVERMLDTECDRWCAEVTRVAGLGQRWQR